MTTTLLLIRHGMCDPVGRCIAGRMPGVSLNAEGRSQAESLVRRLAGTGIQAICSSPMERTRETAGPLARSRNLDIEVRPEFNEVEFGEWTGKTFEELDPVPAWHEFNRFRSAFRLPGGETMPEVQARAISGLWDLHRRHAGQTIAVFSHGDVIKAIVAHLMGFPTDFFMRFRIDPASITTVTLDSHGPAIDSLNVRG